MATDVNGPRDSISSASKRELANALDRSCRSLSIHHQAILFFRQKVAPVRAFQEWDWERKLIGRGLVDCAPTAIPSGVAIDASLWSIATHRWSPP
jgi:hypothetical protein